MENNPRLTRRHINITKVLEVTSNLKIHTAPKFQALYKTDLLRQPKPTITRQQQTYARRNTRCLFFRKTEKSSRQKPENAERSEPHDNGIPVNTDDVK